jgi:alpha-beta hydrolase superfamily lysophospholipase
MGLIFTQIASTSTYESDFEASVCGSFREPFTFWLWRTMAGAPDRRRLEGIKNVEQINLKARDATELGGYKLVASEPKGYLLVALGNAMLADQLVADLQFFRDLGLEVYVFDYRGYGISSGKSRLVAIIADYEAIVSHLNALGYAKRFLYGISMGGIILLNATARSAAYTKLVVDSSPSRIAPLGCPERYDPVNQLPEDSSRIMIISGARDNVVPPRQMDELLQVAQSRGARIVRDHAFAHPYQDAYHAVHKKRQEQVAEFLSRQ